MCVMFVLAFGAAIASMDWDRFVRALGLAGCSMKEAAISMGVSAPQFSRQIRGQEHMHVDRWAALPVAFHQWYALLTLEAVGLPVEVTRASRIEHALSHRQQLRMGAEPRMEREMA